jgi:hypothetical protein
MTRFGKALVFINLAFSLLLATWAFSLYANGIDWSNRKAKGDELPGEFTIKEDQLKDLWQGLPPAQSSWLSARQQLRTEEARLVADRKWYDEEMNHLFVTANAANPVGEITVAAKDDDKAGIRKGQIQLDANGLPQLVALTDRSGKPLQSLAVYNNEDEKVLQSLAAVRQKHEEQINEAKKLTDEITGDPKNGVRGLWQRILDEKAKNADVVAEQKLLEPLLINTVVDSQLIFKRRTQLDRRIKELKNIGVASDKSGKVGDR